MKEELITEDKHPKIYDWLVNNVNSYLYNHLSFTLTENGEINVASDVSFSNYLERFQYPFGCVEGRFTCWDCIYIESLENCPKEINRGIYIRNCPKLKSLQHLPKNVIGDVSIIGCPLLTSLDGCPEEILGSFYCNGCDNLRSLTHFHKIDGDFEISYIPSLISLIGLPKNIKSFRCSTCDKLTSLIGCPNKIKSVLYISKCNNLLLLIGLPKHFKGSYAYINNDYLWNNKKKEHVNQYKHYVSLWLEFFESINNEERKFYIEQYKNVIDPDTKNLFIPIEILKEYGF